MAVVRVPVLLLAELFLVRLLGGELALQLGLADPTRGRLLLGRALRAADADERDDQERDRDARRR